MTAKQTQSGFTLIELMIVVAIIGILAAIAIPAYQNYTIRAQVTEGMSLAGGVQTGIDEYFADNGTFPTCITTAVAGAAGCVATTGAITGKYVSGLTMTTGSIVITYASVVPQQANKAINGLTLTFVPYVSKNNDIVWVCGSAVVPTSATIPTGVTAVAATIPAQYLPTACHS
jgi:type IV pilus assembly protein PilA